MNPTRLRHAGLALTTASMLCLLTTTASRPAAQASRAASPATPSASPAGLPLPSAAATPGSVLNPTPAALQLAPTPQPTLAPGTNMSLVPSPSANPSPSSTQPPAPTAGPTATPDSTVSSQPERGRHHHATASPSPSATPTSPAFSTLDGYWEVVVQTNTKNAYSRFDLRQDVQTLTGVWTDQGKKRALAGTYDGRLFKLTAKSEPRDLTLTGYVESASDMVGVVDDGSGKDPTAFTASHRPAHRESVFSKHAKLPK